MVTFINHVAIAAPRNGTTTHTVTPSSGTVVAGALFTPTAGSLLVCVVEGGVTSTTPSGWTLPSGGSAVNMTGLYLWHRTAVGGDSLTTTHNSSNYPVVFDFYEFAAGSTFVGSASATGTSASGGAGPTLSGLTGTNWATGVVGMVNASGVTHSVTWSNGVEQVDTSVPQSGSDGYTYSLTLREDYASATSSSAATVTYTVFTTERLVFAVKPVAGGSTPNTATGAGSWSFAGTGAAKRAPKATGAGTFTFAGAGSSKRTPKATGSGAWGFAGSGTGKRVAKAAGAGAWSFTGTGVGQAVDPDAATATGSGAWSFTGAGAGKRAPKGTGSGSWSFAGTGAATAVDPDVATGQGVGAWSFVGAGVGKRVPVATGSGAWGFVGTGSTQALRDITITVGAPTAHPLTVAAPTGRALTVGAPEPHPLTIGTPRS